MENDSYKCECLNDRNWEKIQFEKDCYFYQLLQTFYKLQRLYHCASPAEKEALKSYLNSAQAKIVEASQKLECFPKNCSLCAGMARCQKCPSQESCIKMKFEIPDDFPS